MLRRAVLSLHFARPGDAARELVFCRMLEGTNSSESQIRDLVKLTHKQVPYTYSDLTDRIARLALRQAWKSDRPFGVEAVKRAIADIEPSPLMDFGLPR